MAATRQAAVGMDRPPTTSPPVEVLPPGRPSSATEPRWLWESVRYRFWQPADLASSIQHAGPFTPEQAEAIAYWWSLLAAVEGLGPRAYAAAFVRATERRDSEQVRWSLLAMLRDELQHEQLCHLVLRRLAPGWPLHDAPPADLGRHLRDVHERAEHCWRGYRSALDQHGVGVAVGGLLLVELVTGALYEGWATTCTIPTFTTAFRHAARDAQRHQAVLRALVARDWPLLEATGRSEAAAQVEAAASFLSAVVAGPHGGQPETPADLEAHRAGFGVPTAEQRQEILRAALLQVKDLQLRYGIPFPAMPELAIAGTEKATARRESEMRVSERCHHVLITTEPDETLVDAAGRMSCYQIGALPVYQQHRLVGIVTERDVVAALADGMDPATTTVADYMTDRPVTVAPDDDLAVAAHRMAELGVRHLPVVDGQQLVGVLSIRDLLVEQATPTLAG